MKNSQLIKIAEDTFFDLTSEYCTAYIDNKLPSMAATSSTISNKYLLLNALLINEMKLDDNEYKGIIAHEAGHYKHKHKINPGMHSMFPFTLLEFCTCFFISAITEMLLCRFDNRAESDLSCLIYFSISLVACHLLKMNQRRQNEYQADAFAADNGYSKDLAKVLKKISIKEIKELESIGSRFIKSNDMKVIKDTDEPFPEIIFNTQLTFIGSLVYYTGLVHLIDLFTSTHPSNKERICSLKSKYLNK